MKKIVQQLKFIALLGTVAALVPISTYALSSETAFGGMQTLIYDSGVCNCSGTNVHKIMDYTNNSLLELYYGGGKLYNNNNIDTISGYQLGTYSPTSTPCMVESGPSCYQYALATGTYGSAPGTGTSMRNGGELLDSFITKVAKTLKQQGANG